MLSTHRFVKYTRFLVKWVFLATATVTSGYSTIAAESRDDDGPAIGAFRPGEGRELKRYSTATVPDGTWKWKSTVSPECGANSLYVMLRLRDVPVNHDVLRTRLPTKGDGASLLQLKEEATSLGLHVANYETTPAGLGDYELPLIARMSPDAENPQGHYVVVTYVDDELVRIVDGSTGQSVRMSPATFSEVFSGQVLALRPSIWLRILPYTVILVLVVELFFLVKLSWPLVRRRWSGTT